jgi:hypothetical protein
MIISEKIRKLDWEAGRGFRVSQEPLAHYRITGYRPCSEQIGDMPPGCVIFPKEVRDMFNIIVQK